ncbi:alpha-1,3-rhamnosyl/mannosyltransferase [Pseudomonas fluvialis]|uniref:Alpha-1,3-rhamnosyl/mannosyltransferase n=1 Tax=Pseudomonas fluvialis TaxID=1793966 RepID=A0A7X0BRP2_9PSED|nr:glycosyltransferase family 1 protein [Pseudomonas fluvialis]MBB6340560.1 alpha-1,3-rhamnosyl/mannosyltransferase [Pseudomonas fluvialis]
MPTSVAFNASILRAPRTGIGQYAVELCRALQARGDLHLEIFSGWNWQHDLPEAAMPGYAPASQLVKRLLPNAYAWRRRVEQHRFSNGIGKLKPALYHEPSLWPFNFEGPSIMTLHDLTHVHFPHTQPPDRLREIEKHIHRSIERCARILVDSQFIAEEARQYYGVPEHKLVVAPLGFAPRFHPRSAGELATTLHTFGITHRQYLLCVGTLEPRKNLALAIRSYLSLPRALRERYPMLLAGLPGWQQDQMGETFRHAVRDNHIRLLGYQDDVTLAELVAGARLLLYPSLYEGFGLPVLESMASGTPVITSSTASLPEVAGCAGTYVNPQDEDEFKAALCRLLEDDAEWHLKRQAGLNQATRFSWQRCAQITAETYFDLLRP